MTTPTLPTQNEFRPGRLWSLWDIMQTISGSGLLQMANSMGIWGMPSTGDNDAINRGTALKNADVFEGYISTLTALGISGAKVSLQKFIAALRKDGCTWLDIRDLAKQVAGRLIDETADKQFFSLSPHENELFTSPRRGWELSVARFPQILDDVEEASKCLALSRYPSTIFHSLQIVEVALIELGKFLKVKDPTSGWTAVAGALAKFMKKERKDLSRYERKNRAFLEQVHGTVEGMKNAWRNKISHVDGRLILVTKEFSPEIAEEILFATRAFVRRLAEGLPPAKAKKPSLESLLA